MDDNDVHQHRRSDDKEDLQSHRLQAAAQSTAAMMISRLVTPALLTALLAVSAYIGSRLVNQLDEQGRDLSAVKSDVRDLNTRMTEGILRQVNDHNTRLENHEERLQNIERSVPTP